jgi:hypothetical protein
MRRLVGEIVMTHRSGLVFLLCFGLASCAGAQSPQLTLPDFSALRSRATDAVDITIGPLPLRLVGWAMDHDNDPDSDVAQARSVLKGIQALTIRHYEFASDFAYSKSDLEAVRRQLAGSGWSQVAHVRDQKKSEDVDVYLAMENDRITGLAILACEPREFTIVNAVGSLSKEQVDALRGRFLGHHDAVAWAHAPFMPL